MAVGWTDDDSAASADVSTFDFPCLLTVFKLLSLDGHSFMGSLQFLFWLGGPSTYTVTTHSSISTPEQIAEVEIFECVSARETSCLPLTLHPSDVFASLFRIEKQNKTETVLANIGSRNSPTGKNSKRGR